MMSLRNVVPFAFIVIAQSDLCSNCLYISVMAVVVVVE